MNKLAKNLIIEGPLSVECPDTAGEVLDVHGADISDLQTGRAPVNTEHQNPEDISKGGQGDGFQAIVGRVITAKKIYGESDCESPDELKAYNDLHVPMIWGKIEIFDGPTAHDNAKAAASIIRNYDESGVKQLLGYSVEGNTLKREGNILRSTIIKRIALTAKPANKAAVIQNVQESPQSPSNSMSKSTGLSGGYEPLYKSENFMSHMRVVGNDHGLSKALFKLKKALDAGGMNAAPGSLVQGSALQKESQLKKLKRKIGHKKISRESLKMHLPNVSEENLDKIEAVLKHQEYENNVKAAQDVLDVINTKKVQ